MIEEQEWLPLNDHNWNTIIEKLNEMIDLVNEHELKVGHGE